MHWRGVLHSVLLTSGVVALGDAAFDLANVASPPSLDVLGAFFQSDFVPWLMSRRIGSLLLGLLLVYVSWNHFRHRGTPLALQSVSVVLDFQDPFGGAATLERIEELQPYQYDVGAYHEHHVSDGAVSLDPNEFTIKPVDTQEVIDTGNPASLRILHLFKSPLAKTVISSPLISRFREPIIRKSKVSIKDAFTQKCEYYEFTTLRYPAKNVDIEIRFDARNPPLEPKCKAFRIINENAAKVLHPICSSDGNRKVLKLHLRKSVNEKILVRWEFAHDPKTMRPQPSTR
jgi:hypothetical protein